jgi:hypothetical protein
MDGPVENFWKFIWCRKVFISFQTNLSRNWNLFWNITRTWHFVINLFAICTTAVSYGFCDEYFVSVQYHFADGLRANDAIPVLWGNNLFWRRIVFFLKGIWEECFCKPCRMRASVMISHIFFCRLRADIFCKEAKIVTLSVCLFDEAASKICWENEKRDSCSCKSSRICALEGFIGGRKDTYYTNAHFGGLLISMSYTVRYRKYLVSSMNTAANRKR